MSDPCLSKTPLAKLSSAVRDEEQKQGLQQGGFKDPAARFNLKPSRGRGALSPMRSLIFEPKNKVGYARDGRQGLQAPAGQYATRQLLPAPPPARVCCCWLAHCA